MTYKILILKSYNYSTAWWEWQGIEVNNKIDTKAYIHFADSTHKELIILATMGWCCNVYDELLLQIKIRQDKIRGGQKSCDQRSNSVPAWGECVMVGGGRAGAGVIADRGWWSQIYNLSSVSAGARAVKYCSRAFLLPPYH